MLSFRCDYAEGAHPEILKRLTETNFEQLDGYGNDPFTRSITQFRTQIEEFVLYPLQLRVICYHA